MDNYSSHREKVTSKIEKFVVNGDLINFSTRVLKIIFTGLIAFVLFAFFESILYFSTTIRSFLFLALFIVTLIFIIYETVLFFKNIIQSRSFERISKAATEIGSHYRDINDKLLNVLQILRVNAANHSKNLANAAFEEVYKKIENIDFSLILDKKRLKRSLIFVSSISLSAFIFLFTIPQLREASYRVLYFNTEFEKPQEFTLTSLFGNRKVKKGEDVEVLFRSTGNFPQEINIETRTTSESEFKSNRRSLDSNNLYSLQIRNVKSSFQYFAHESDIRTDTFKVSVVNPPIINELNFEIIPPTYSKLQKKVQENNGNITALKGTKVSFDLLSSKNILNAKRIFNKGEYDSLSIEDNMIRGSFYITGNDNYYFEIIDLENNKNENPIDYEISIIPDNYPVIKVLRPDQFSLIPANDIVTINYEIDDDFGFSKVLLRYKIMNDNISDETIEFKEISLKFDRMNIDQTLFYNWDLSRLNLRESEEISYYLEVFDNDFVSGPKSTKSKLLKLRVPTLEELFAEADNTQENVINELNETLSEAEKLQSDFKKIRDELKKDKEKLEWNEKERINESIQKFEELTDKIEEIQSKLDQMREKISENNLLSEETMQKYNELQDLMDELNSEDLQKALQDMQKSLENLLRENVQKSLEDLSINEEFFKKSIERTINLLKKIQIEQKMDEIVKRSEKLISDLEDIKKETQNLNEEGDKSKSDQIADENIKTEKQLNSLESRMEDLRSKMEEVSDMPYDRVKELSEKFKEQKNEDLAKQTTSHLKDNKLLDALKNQEQVSSNMSSLLSEMKDIQNQMQQQTQQMVLQNMLKSIDNILSLSKDQEAFSNEVNSMRSRPRELPGKAEKQMEMIQSLDKILKQLSELSQKTFAITPEMGEALGNARRNMGLSISGMQNRNSQRSTFNQGEALKNLNEAALLLQNSLKAMMQGGGQGGGMMSLMQQLQQMAQQQMGLNKMTQMMQSGQLTMQQQAQLQRLAQQQAALQKSLSELNKEARESGQSKKISTNLEKVLQDMKELVSGLNTQKIDDDLIKKQEKILSKLLDAQRSINERDFEENRESFSGDEFNLTSPEDLILGDEESQDLLREELLRSIQNGYSKDYENIIRRYFESLNQNSENN